jgi:sugar/nucleoside kinase (ribokinase family)
MPRYDYTSMGFYTYDCLGWPFNEIPPGGGTVFIDELTLAVSGAGGTAAIAAAKMGLKTLAVTGVGQDLMGDWVIERLAHFGVDIWGVQRKPGWKTSSSIVTTRADGSRPALHMKGATMDFVVDDDMFARVTDCKVFHAGGIGLTEAMDRSGQSAKLMPRVRKQRLMCLQVHPKICRRLQLCFPSRIISCPQLKRRKRCVVIPIMLRLQSSFWIWA